MYGITRRWRDFGCVTDSLNTVQTRDPYMLYTAYAQKHLERHAESHRCLNAHNRTRIPARRFIPGRQPK